MPLQEFWYDDPDLLWAYRKSYIEKEKAKFQGQREMVNLHAWLQGYYNHIAIVSSLDKNTKYLSQPIELDAKPKTEKDKKIEIARKVKERIIKGKLILEQQRSEKKG